MTELGSNSYVVREICGSGHTLTHLMDICGSGFTPQQAVWLYVVGLHTAISFISICGSNCASQNALWLYVDGVACRNRYCIM